MLRSSGQGSVAVSAADLQLTAPEEQDLERYLDVTRAEILFARGVVLVEGDAEVFLIPRIASFIGHDLDAFGVSVCSVGGTNFTPHVKLLQKLGTPFAVVTDYDADEDGGSLGEERVIALMAHLMQDEYRSATRDVVLAQASLHGIFLGTSTFEIDLLRAGHSLALAKAVEFSAVGQAMKRRAVGWQKVGTIPPADEEQFLKDVVRVGKGRFAQRLASTLVRTNSDDAYAQGPRYVIDALSSVVTRCQR
jgi:putative ATP-dependent endonuclease of OLD family